MIEFAGIVQGKIFPILEFEGIDIYHTKSMTSGAVESVSYFQSRRREDRKISINWLKLKKTGELNI